MHIRAPESDKDLSTMDFLFSESSSIKESMLRTVIFGLIKVRLSINFTIPILNMLLDTVRGSMMNLIQHH